MQRRPTLPLSLCLLLAACGSGVEALGLAGRDVDGNTACDPSADEMCELSTPAAGGYAPRFDPSAPASNAARPIVRYRCGGLDHDTCAAQKTIGFDPDVLMRLHGNRSLARVDISPDQYGGGYLGYVNVVRRRADDSRVESGNLAAYRYGRGWQSSIRDALRSGRHNPTQAGFSDVAGARVALRPRLDDEQRVKRVDIRKFAVPLFQNAELDFTQREDLAPDRHPSDGGAHDDDGFDEAAGWGAGFSQDDEVRSEFDFGGFYDDLSPSLPADKRIPTFQHRYYYAYARAPKTVHQFGQAPVFRGDEKLARAFSTSADLAGVQPTQDDYSGIVSSWGLRNYENPQLTYRYFMFRDPGSPSGWYIDAIPVESSGRSKAIIGTLDDLANPDASLARTVSGGRLTVGEHDWLPVRDERGLMLVATSDDPRRAQAMGLYVPRNHVNTNQVIARDRDGGAVLYSENRRLQTQFQAINVNAETLQTNLVYRVVYSGLFNPDNEAMVERNAVEGFYTDLVVLFGTPEEILEAVDWLEAHRFAAP